MAMSKRGTGELASEVAASIHCHEAEGEALAQSLKGETHDDESHT